MTDIWIEEEVQELDSSGGRPTKVPRTTAERPAIILYVQAQADLFEIDLRVPSPSLVPRVNFVKEHLPIGMGFFKFVEEDITTKAPTTRVFAIGGELLKEDASEHDAIQGNWNAVDESCGKDPFYGMLTDVFEFDFSNYKFSRSASVPNLTAPKANPIVVQINGKVFVHQSLPMFHTSNTAPFPMFEYYDPASKQWQNVANVRYSVNCGGVTSHDGAGYGLYVVGDRLFIPFDLDNPFSCFNARSVLWEEDAGPKLHLDFGRGRLEDPCFGVSVSGLDNLKDCSVLFAMPRKVIYAYLIHKSGRLLRYQALDDMSKDFKKLIWGSMAQCLLDLGKCNMCALVSGASCTNGTSDYRLYLCVFTVRLSTTVTEDIPSCPVEGQFIDVDIHCENSYPLPVYGSSPVDLLGLELKAFFI